MAIIVLLYNTWYLSRWELIKKNYLHILKLPFFYFKIKVLAVVHGVMFFTELILLFLNIYLMTFAIHKMHIFVLGTFLCNNEKERKRYKLSERTVSLW